MLSCNGIVLNYAFVLYNKSISKIDLVQSIAKELPVPPVMSYFLCDCWYASEKIIHTFVARGFHTISALKTNRMLYPFGNPKALRAFLCTDVSLSTDEILSYYICRWSIEVFFRQYKNKLGLDSYQICSVQGIRRYWLLMSLAHDMCVIGTGEFCSFENGYHRIRDLIQLEKYRYIFQCAKANNDFDSFMKLAIQFWAIFQICSFIDERIRTI